MNVEFNLVYGGFVTYFKKDANGNKTNEEYTMYTLYEKDVEHHSSRQQIFNLKGANPLKVNADLFSMVKAVIRVSATSNYKELVSIK